MNRIDSIFAGLRGEGRKALMPFITGGYPSLEATRALLPALEAGGARICEVGFPFSDPIADGPIIQASMVEALGKGVTTSGLFDAIRDVRPNVKLGLVAMVSYSIVYRIGADVFIPQAAEAGFDGFIFPDLPLEESPDISKRAADAGLISSLLIAPTTPDDRAARIAEASTGFVYLLARTGITGERADLPPGLEQRVTKLRNATDLPLAVGFGVSSPQQVRAVTHLADAAIVGSALVRRIKDCPDTSPKAVATATENFTRELATGLV